MWRQHIFLSFSILYSLLLSTVHVWATTTITMPPNSSPISGAAFTLTCTSSLSNIVWKKGGNTLSNGVGDVTSNGGSYKRTLTFNPLQAAHGGVYSCEAGSESIDKTLIVEAPTLELPQMFPTIGVLSHYYAGTPLRFQCLIAFDALTPISDPDFNIYISWLKNDVVLSEDDRIHFDPTPTTVIPTKQFTGFQEFDYIILSDTDAYTCNVTVYSTLEFVANGSRRSNEFDLTVINPIPNVILTASLYKVPIHPDYNTVTLLCSDALPSDLKEDLFVDKQYTWTVNDTDTTDGVQGPVDPDERESYGSLTISITEIGTTVVTCTVSIEVPGDPVISSNDSAIMTALAPSVPVSPTDLQSMNISMSSVVIYWTTPYLAYTPEQYTVYYGTSQSSLTSYSDVINGSTNLTSENVEYSATLMGLETNTLYYYRIRSSNTEGVTNSTSIGNFTTLRIEVPSEHPRNFTIVTVSSTIVTLRWRSVRLEARNAPITSYSISCNSSHPTHQVNADPLLEETDTGAQYKVNVTNLNPYTMYLCKLYANNSGGAGPVVMAGIRTFEDRPSSAPSDVEILGIRSSAVRVSWSQPSVPNGVIVQYTVYIDLLNGTTAFKVIDGHQMEYIVTNLMPYQLIRVSLSASTSLGEGPRSVSIEGRSTESAPYALVGVKYHVLSPSRLKVNFTKPSLDITRGVVLYYNVIVREHNSGEDGQTATIYGNSTSLEAFISGLEGEIPYNVSVFAVNSAGAGDVTSKVLFTKEGIPPPPDNVISERINGTHMKVTWTPLSLARAKGFIINYSISYSRVTAATTSTNKRQSGSVLVPANETVVIIGQLTPSASYTVIVSAINSAGEGIESTSLIVNEFETSEDGGVFTTMNIIIGVCVILGLIVIIVIAILIVLLVRRRYGSNNDSVNISQDHKVIVPAHIQTGPSMAYGQLPATPEPILDCESLEKSQMAANNPMYNYAYSKPPPCEHTYESIDQLKIAKNGFDSYDVPKPQLPAPRPSMSKQSSHSASENS